MFFLVTLSEMTSNDHHPVTSPCSPRKMKKENVPIKTELTGDDPSQFQPSAKARLTPKINRIRMSALDSADNTTTSPQKTRVSLGISPTKRSPIKAVASLKLERAQGWFSISWYFLLCKLFLNQRFIINRIISTGFYRM